MAPQQLTTAIGADPRSPPLDAYASRWNADQVEWKGTRVENFRG
jgi:hypothetical protein